MKLQERFSSLSPIYNGGLTNHLPMMITALRLLDVAEQDIEVIASNYVKDKNIMDLQDHSFESEYHSEYVRLTNYYLNQFKSKSIEYEIGIFLNGKLNSLHSALYHGLIRLAYAYIDGTPLLVAQALAYFELSSNDVQLSGKQVEVDNIDNEFQKLLLSKKEKVKFKEHSTYAKYQVVYKNLSDELFVPKHIKYKKMQVLEFFLNYFNKTKDFYILHVITGYHAMHVLSQFFDDQDTAFEQFFLNAIIFMTFNEHSDYLTDQTQNEFHELVKKVNLLNDAHDIKLFLSLSYFYERYELEELKTSLQLIFT